MKNKQNRVVRDKPFSSPSTDPLGSWTGTNVDDENETPPQDADDL